MDPNDGTRDYLEGRRGSSVSIGLVAGGLPVLGVVFAFAYPDDDGDLFAWAQGQGPLLRNGRPVAAAPAPALRASDVILLSSTGDLYTDRNLERVAPARFRTVPSIAHRLALVAAGEAAATSAQFAPREWDYGGGHALLRAMGGILLDETGALVRYAEDGTSRTQWTLGGSPAVVQELLPRAWIKDRNGVWGPDRPALLVRGEAVEDAALLSRAQGCLLGLVAGGSVGASRSPSGLLEDGERLLAGQPTGAVENALVLTRSIVSRGSYDAHAALEAYKAWLVADGSPAEQAGRHSLARMIPLGLFAHRLAADEVADMARRDCLLTGADPEWVAAGSALAVGVAHAIARADGPQGAHGAALDWARNAGAPHAVTEVLHAVFAAALHAGDAASGVRAAANDGNDAAVDAALAGGLLGAVHGRPAIPAQWRSMVLSCHPHPLRTARPRPRSCWPTDVFELAERLLLAGLPSPGR